MLSVVTITYKDARGLAATIDSLRGVDPSTFEHVVVDSSPEANTEVLAALPAGWPLRHVVVPPRGIYAALNEGIRSASGDVLWFLNGGDRLVSPAALAEALAELEATPALDVLVNGVWPTRDGVRLEQAVIPGGFRPGADTPLADAVVGRCGLTHQGMLYRKRVFDRVGPYAETYRIVGDYEHHWRLVLAGVSGRLSARVLAEFDMSGASNARFPLWRREMNALNAWLKPRVPAEVYARHRNLDRRWRVLHGLKLASARFPGVQRVIAPIWRRVSSRLTTG